MRRLHLAKRRITKRGTQINHRNGLSTVLAGPGQKLVRPRHAFQRRSPEHLTHLEHIDAEKLIVAEAKQQHRHTVMSGQLGMPLDLFQQRAAHRSSLRNATPHTEAMSMAYRPTLRALERQR
jgi:hypothetical protein